MGDRGHNTHGAKRGGGGLLCPFRRELVPSNTFYWRTKSASTDVLPRWSVRLVVKKSKLNMTYTTKTNGTITQNKIKKLKPNLITLFDMLTCLWHPGFNLWNSSSVRFGCIKTKAPKVLWYCFETTLAVGRTFGGNLQQGLQCFQSGSNPGI